MDRITALINGKYTPGRESAPLTPHDTRTPLPHGRGVRMSGSERNLPDGADPDEGATLDQIVLMPCHQVLHQQASRDHLTPGLYVRSA